MRVILLLMGFAGLLLLATPGLLGQEEPPATPAPADDDAPVSPTDDTVIATNYLQAPLLVHAGEEPIETTVGHSHAIVVDWDDDGVQDLLVGQFGGGLLRYYRNVGTAEAPVYDDFTMVQAGGVDASIPSG